MKGRKAERKIETGNEGKYVEKTENKRKTEKEKRKEEIGKKSRKERERRNKG